MTTKLAIWIGGIAGLVILFAIGVRSVYEKGEAAGKATVEAECSLSRESALREARDKAAEDLASMIKQRDALKVMLDVRRGEREERTSDAIEIIRTVYRDVPVPAACVYPDRVQDALEAARQRANAAGRGLPGRSDGRHPAAPG